MTGAGSISRENRSNRPLAHRSAHDGVLVFTNGCFDLLHPGHVDLLERARALGDRLVVGLNSDASVRAIRGPGRPLVPQEDRAAMLRALRCVDEVIIFDEPTPARLIEELQPDVLVKGGDWPVDQIVGADTVLRKGGRVLSLPLKPGYSTSALIERILALHRQELQSSQQTTTVASPLPGLAESIAVKQRLLSEQAEAIQKAGHILVDALLAGGKVLLFGNGGSAADAQHIAAELVGRFEAERRGWPAIALTTDTSALTALSNDYGYEHVFARQVEALAQPGDVVVAISTSGNSRNVLAAVMAARRRGCKVIGLTGAEGKRLASLSDAAVLVPSRRTARIQEAHITIGHLWCEMVDACLSEAREP
jgi:phosphoheptose isomerase